MRLLILMTISLLACDLSQKDESQVLIFEIPEVVLEEQNPNLSMAQDGLISFDSLPFSGYLVSYYSDSTIKSKKGYYKGKLEGDYLSYYPSGQVFSLRPYHLGEKHGKHLGYFESGQLKFHYHFVEGFSQGVHKEWYENGTPKKIMNYIDGHEFGSQKYWRRDGKLRSNYVVRENGRKYGMLGLKRCAKIDSETGDIDPYKGNM